MRTPQLASFHMARVEPQSYPSLVSFPSLRFFVRNTSPRQPLPSFICNIIHSWRRRHGSIFLHWHQYRGGEGRRWQKYIAFDSCPPLSLFIRAPNILATLVLDRNLGNFRSGSRGGQISIEIRNASHLCQFSLLPCYPQPFCRHNI